MDTGPSNQQDSPPVPPTPEELDVFRSLIRRFTGLDFDQWRLDTVERALTARMAATGVRQTRQYLDLLQQPARRAEEFAALLDQLTVNETYFFRYPIQFDFLRQTVLPELSRRRRGQPIRIWCAGCSTGEEPYSVAVTALDVFGPAAGQSVEVLATDVGAGALRVARQARYASKSLRLVDGLVRARYFRPVGSDQFVLCERARRLVVFRQSNLVDDAAGPPEVWDVIFCRNVLMYLARDSARHVVAGLRRCLKDDGYLFVGHADVLDLSEWTPCGPEGAFAFQPRRRSPAREPSTPQAAAADSATPEPQPAAPSGPLAVETDLQNVEAVFQRAWQSFEREEFTEALQLLDQLLQRQPRHRAATLLRANTLLHLGQHDHSVRECQVVLQLDPFAFEAYLLLGLNFQRLRKPELAVSHLRKAAYLAPDSPVVQFHLAEAYRAAGKPSLARRAYANALSTLPLASERQLELYCGGFGRSAVKELCERHLAAAADAGSEVRAVAKTQKSGTDEPERG